MSLPQLVKLSKSAIRCKHTRLQLVLSSPEGSNLHSKQRSEPLTLQRAHSRPLALNRKMKKYTPTPIAAELFPNFISDVGEVSRPELFEQFCVPIKNSWLLFSRNYLRKSKNWMSFEDLECGVRRPANLHLPLKSLSRSLSHKYFLSNFNVVQRNKQITNITLYPLLPLQFKTPTSNFITTAVISVSLRLKILTAANKPLPLQFEAPTSKFITTAVISVSS